MALALNTSAALYPYLKSLVCVDGGVIKDLVNTGLTFTQHANAGGIVASRGYGEAFRVARNGQFAGYSVTPSSTINIGSDATKKTTIFVAFNAFVAPGNVGNLFGNVPLIQLDAEGKVSSSASSSFYTTKSVSNIAPSTFATPAPCTVAVQRLGNVANGVYHWLNGVLDSGSPLTNTTGQQGYTNTNHAITTIGNNDGNGSVDAEIVYIAVFQGVTPTNAQIQELHNSLTGNNAFALVTTGGGGTNIFATASAAAIATATATATVAGGGVTASAIATATASATATVTIYATATAQAVATASATGTANTGSTQLILPALKNNTGMLLASISNITCHIYDVASGAKIVTKTAQSTDSQGVITLSDALLIAATPYRVVIILPSGAEGMGTVTTTS